MVFVTHTTECTRQTMVFVTNTTKCTRQTIGKYLNHCIIIVVFLWSSSTYDPHINNSRQDNLTNTFFELQSRSRLEARLYISHLVQSENNCCTICNKNHETTLIKSCLRWILFSLDQSYLSKLHAYLSKKSSVYHRVNIDFFAISDHKHTSAKKAEVKLQSKAISI